MTRTTLELVQGEPRSYVIAVNDEDPITHALTPINVSTETLTLSVHERDDGDPALDDITVVPLTPPTTGYGRVAFTAEQTAGLATDLTYVYRLRRPSGESVDDGDLRVARPWR